MRQMHLAIVPLCRLIECALQIDVYDLLHLQNAAAKSPFAKHWNQFSLFIDLIFFAHLK